MRLEDIDYFKKNKDTYVKIDNHFKHCFITTIKFDSNNKNVMLKKQLYLKRNKKFLRGMPINLEFEEIKAICDESIEYGILSENYEDLKYLLRRYNYKIAKINNQKDDYKSIMNGIRLKKGDFNHSETLVICYRKAFKTIDISRYLIDHFGDRIRNFEIILRPEDVLIIKKFCEKKNWK